MDYRISHSLKYNGIAQTPGLHMIVNTMIDLCDSNMFGSWQSGYSYLNKGECDLNQSKDDSFVKRVAKNN